METEEQSNFTNFENDKEDLISEDTTEDKSSLTVLCLKDHVALRRQVLTTLPIMSGCLIYGMVSGFPSAVITQSKGNSSSISINESTESWIASSPLLTMVIGIVLNMYVSRNYGRRRALLFTYTPFAVAWILVSCSASTVVLILSCLLLGVVSGFQCISPTVYVAEISSPRYRRILVTIAKSFNNAGVLACHAMAASIDWRRISVVAAAISFVTQVSIIFCTPETPYWLVMNGQSAKGSRTYFWLRNNAADAVQELRLLVRTNGGHTRMQKPKGWPLLATKTFGRSCGVVAISMTFLMATGYYTLLYYAHPLFGRLLSDVDVNVCVVVVDVIRFVASIGSFLVVNAATRARLFVISSGLVFGCLLALIGCCVYEVPGRITFIVVCVHTFVVSASLLPLTYVILSEIFPIAVRELGNGMSTIFHNITLFFVIKTAPRMFNSIGLVQTLGIYAFAMVICFAILRSSMPQTDKLSLPQIEIEMESKNEITTTV